MSHNADLLTPWNLYRPRDRSPTPATGSSHEADEGTAEENHRTALHA